MTDEALQQFAEELLRDVDEGLSSDIPFSQEVFTRMIQERLEEAGHLEGTFDLYQEGRLRNGAAYRIDGYSFDEERMHLDLFTTIFQADLPPEKLPAADVSKAFERALRFAGACMDGLASQLEPSNTDASDLARLIEAKASEINSIRIVLLSNAVVGKFAASTDWRGRTIDQEAYDVVRLQRILGEGQTRADISVDLVALTGSPVPSLHAPTQDGEYDAYLTVLPADVLSKVYERYGVRLLELNVRAFLGLQGRKSVNAELRRTIVEHPSMFLAFNNGIVATVDDLDVSEAEHGACEIRSLQGLQIVNGGQTTASLHRTARRKESTLANVAVPVKIIKVGGADLGEMVASISRAANRQNTVQLADFSANDPFHQQVETLANNTWLDDGRGRWFYERARGSYLAAEQKAAYRKTEQQTFKTQTPKNRRLSKLDLARYLSAWSGLPHRVCLGGQKNFQHFMQRLKDEPPPPTDTAWFKKLVAIAILYRAVEKKIRSMKFPAYGAQITTYIVAGLSHRTGGRIDFGRLWSRQQVSVELERLVEAWAPQIDVAMRRSAGQRNPSEWYKKEDCWKEMQTALPSLADPLPPELSYSESNGGTVLAPIGAHSVADYERIERCMKVGSAQWLEVAEKGQKNGLIHYKVAGICRTLASYAAGGWERKPSVKQAKPALDAVLAVGRAGLIQSTVTDEAAS
ncbi:MAG: AIPR protein [Mesorhizobium sp.]|uniref:AIPR family protein n=1 Tax=Mesorhizobium sp. TaxID=1871066 RepID=UPI000FE50F38|nr:AIPR family protein [Mesorhizobium sp.]RWP10972.1 MAG: AIPR protein [Mesorhizobium sp.]